MLTNDGVRSSSAHHYGHVCRGRLKEFGELIREAANEWSNDNAPRLGASLAYYTLLSLAPLLVVIIAVAAYVFGRQAAEGQLAWQIEGLVGIEEAKAIQAVIRAAMKPVTGVVATTLSILTLLVGATSVVVELRDALNIIWHVPATNSKTIFGGFLVLLKQRFYAFAVVLGIGFLLLVSLILSAWIAAVGKVVGTCSRCPNPFCMSSLS
jgi:membrane protein